MSLEWESLITRESSEKMAARSMSSLQCIVGLQTLCWRNSETASVTLQMMTKWSLNLCPLTFGNIWLHKKACLTNNSEMNNFIRPGVCQVSHLYVSHLLDFYRCKKKSFTALKRLLDWEYFLWNILTRLSSNLTPW